MSLDTRTVGDGDMQPCNAILRVPNASSTMALTSLKTIDNLGGVVRQIRKLTPLASKQKKVICAHILSSVSIVTEITKWTQMYVHSRNIGSIVNGMSKNILRPVKTGRT